MPRPCGGCGEHLAPRDRAEGADQAPVAPEAPARRVVGGGDPRLGPHARARRRRGATVNAAATRTQPGSAKAASSSAEAIGRCPPRRRHGESTPPSRMPPGSSASDGQADPRHRLDGRALVEAAPSQRAHAHERAGHRQVAAAELTDRGGRALRSGRPRAPRARCASPTSAARRRSSSRAVHDQGELARVREQHAVAAPQLAVLLEEAVGRGRGAEDGEHRLVGRGRGRRAGRAEVDREVDASGAVTGRVRRGSGEGLQASAYIASADASSACGSAKRSQPPVTASSAPA